MFRDVRYWHTLRHGYRVVRTKLDGIYMDKRKVLAHHSVINAKDTNAHAPLRVT